MDYFQNLQLKNGECITHRSLRLHPFSFAPILIARAEIVADAISDCSGNFLALIARGQIAPYRGQPHTRQQFGETPRHQ
jgi:hypothetical protein